MKISTLRPSTSLHSSQSLHKLGAALVAAVISLGARHAGAQIFFRGTVDNFAEPTEPATPSLGQRNFYTTLQAGGQGALREYDQAGGDAWHMEHFGNLPCGITAASLVFVLKPGTSSLSNNDSFGLDFISPSNTIAWPNAAYGPRYYIRIGASNGLSSLLTSPWNLLNYPSGQIFILDLANMPTPLTGETNLIPRLNQYGFLNVIVQDDTYFDYVNLVVTAGGTPPNDACANAAPLISGATVTGSTTCATPDGTATCGSSNATRSVWYHYVAPCTGMAAVHTCGSTYDTVLSVYTGTCSALTQLPGSQGCNDDASADPCAGSVRSYIAFPATAGQTYYIRVSGFSGGTGAYSLTLVPPAPPSNDACATPLTIANGNHSFDTRCATTDGTSSSDCAVGDSNDVTNDLWYNYTASCTGTLTVSTCNGANFNTRIAIYSAADPCNSTTPRACADDATGCGDNTTQVSLPVMAGEMLRIRVGGHNGAVGTGALTVSCDTICPPSSPDTFVTRTYGITGTASGVPHSWCITVFNDNVEQCRFCDYSITPILASESTDVEMVAAFVNAINSYGFTTEQIEANQITVFDENLQMEVLTKAFKIQMANPVGYYGFTLGVGADGSETGVNSSGLACDPVTTETCYFNPGVQQVTTQGLDCNNNDRDDALDIFLGISLDLNNDGIPDECACPCNWNNDAEVTSQDFFDFLTSFFDGNADINADGITSSQDFFDFLACFFAPPIGC